MRAAKEPRRHPRALGAVEGVISTASGMRSTSAGVSIRTLRMATQHEAWARSRSAVARCGSRLGGGPWLGQAAAAGKHSTYPKARAARAPSRLGPDGTFYEGVLSASLSRPFHSEGQGDIRQQAQFRYPTVWINPCEGVLSKWIALDMLPLK